MSDSDIHKIIRKFERFMGHSDEGLMELGSRSRRTNPSKSDGEIIGHFTYDFEKQTETFTPTLKYRIITSFNRFYSNIYSYFKPKKD